MSVILGRPLDHAKVPFSFKKQILPPLMGVTGMIAVLVGLNFQLLNAKYEWLGQPVTAVLTAPASSPAPSNTGNTAPATSVVSVPSNEARVIIEKLKVNAPIVFEPTVVEWKIQTALRSGVVHYAPTAKPGDTGNIAIFGHSSSYSWAKGDYKFVFAKLDKLADGDLIHVTYQGKQYAYKVTGRRVVNPDAMWVVGQTEDRKQLTLITCYPVGTDKQRLAIIAEQLP